MFIARKEDGTLVQQFIWDKVGFDWNDFSGIKSLTRSDLLHLQALISAELQSQET